MTKPADQIAKARRISEIAERENKATKGPWKKYHRVSPRGAHQQWHIGNSNGACQITMSGFERDFDFMAEARQDIPFLLSELASERQAVKEYCCRAVCDCCGKYAQYWHPAELVNQRWRHLSTKIPDEGKPTTHLCDAAAIRSME